MRSTRKVQVIIFTFIMVISIFSSSIPYNAGGAGKENLDTILLVEKKGFDTNRLDKDQKYSVLEQYESFLLVKTKQKGKNKLKAQGTEIQNLANRDFVGLPSYSFHTSKGEPQITENLKVDEYPEREKGFYIVQFIGPIKSEWKEKITELGATLHEFRHRFNYIVEMDLQTKKDVKKLDFVNWVGRYQPAYRFERKLIESRSQKSSVKVSTFDGFGSNIEKKVSDDLGGDVYFSTENKIDLKIDTEKIVEIAKLHGVKSITEDRNEYRVFNEDATWITQTNEENNRKVTEKGVTGKGELITVMDSELYMQENGTGSGVHEAWEDADDDPIGDEHRKVQKWYVPGDAGGHLEKGAYHGTHVTGSVLGDSPPYGEYSDHDGNALEARVIFQDISDSDEGYVYPPSDMYNFGYGKPYEWGSRVHTNSWGGGSGYVDDAVTADQFIWDNKSFNILYAMGNEGPAANTLSEQPEGKNVISVGAAKNFPDQDQVASFSSRGYADDGRIKPTVLHVGSPITSADRSSDGYSDKSGTSMATPGVAGQVGQVRQYYKDGWYRYGNKTPDQGFNSSNALVRATLINSAVEITGNGAYKNDKRFPNNDQGHGRIKLDRTLYFEGDDRDLRVFDSSKENVKLDTGESWETEFKVDDPGQELEVTLAWSDYPGSSGSDEDNPAIVNDLDLEVTAPNGTKYVGNAFKGYDPGYSEADPTTNPWNGLRDGEYDGLNVEENVLLLPNENGVETGTYEVNVTGHNVPEESQSFALVTSGGLKGEPLPPVNPGPEDGAVGMNKSVDLNITAKHEDGESMEVTFYDASDDSKIGTDYDVASGDQAEVTWNDLESNTTYEWYAEADDDETSTKSEVWHFTTKESDTPYFEVDINSPEEGAKFTENDTILIDYNITNIGEAKGEQDIKSKIYNESEKKVFGDTHKNISIEPQNNHTGTFKWETGKKDAGEYVLEVISKNEVDDVNLTVVKPIKYQMNISKPKGEGTIHVENQLIETFPYSENYKNGTSVDLEAKAKDGYHFVKWSGDNETIVDPKSNQTSIEMLDNYSISAKFSINTYELNVGSSNGGFLKKPHNGSFEYEHGEIINIEAVPNEGYHFVQWTGDNETIVDPKSNQTSIEMLDNYSISAKFSINTYELNVGSSNGGFLKKPHNGSFEYEHGEVINIEAVPNEGYHFVQWIGDNETIENPADNKTTIEMLNNYSITAEFSINTYELTIGSSEGGYVNQQGTYQYDHGKIIDLEAFPDDGHHFVEWNGNTKTLDNLTDNKTSIEILDDYFISATFSVNTYELTIDSSKGGHVEKQGTFQYDHGKVIDLKAVSNEGYHFVQWTGDNETIENPKNNQTSIKMLNDYSISATFSVNTYELTIDSSKGGHVEKQGTFQYDHGKIIELEAIPNEGYHFVQWTGDNETIEDPTENKTSLKIFKDYSITAEFKINTYKITVNSSAGGYVKKPRGSTLEYEHGEIIDLEAIADPGYHFGKWKYDNETIEDSSSNQTTLEILDDYSISATFSLNTYELTLESAEGGKIKEPGEGTFSYKHGTEIDLKAIASEDYHFTGWESNINDLKSKNTTIKMFEDHSISAEFELDSYNLTVNVKPKEVEGVFTINPKPGSHQYKKGEEVTVEINFPLNETRYYFDRWGGDLPESEEQNRTIGIIMDENKEITAHFEKIKIRINSSVGGKVIQPGEGVFNYKRGAKISLKVSADEGYRFTGWIGDTETLADLGSNSSYLIMRSNLTISATFERTMNLTISIEGDGRIKVNGEIVGDNWTKEYKKGTEVDIEVVSNENFETWKGDLDGDDLNIKITMDGDKEITAQFENKISNPNRSIQLTPLLLLLGILGVMITVPIYYELLIN